MDRAEPLTLRDLHELVAGPAANSRMVSVWQFAGPPFDVQTGLAATEEKETTVGRVADTKCGYLFGYGFQHESDAHNYH
jgi:hypothetical protein